MRDAGSDRQLKIDLIPETRTPVQARTEKKPATVLPEPKSSPRARMQAARSNASVTSPVQEPTQTAARDNTQADQAQTNLAQQAQPQQAPGLTADRMVSNALRNVGKIDRDLRQQLPRRPDDTASSDYRSALEKAIAAAGKKTSFTTEELRLSDGSRITKVSGPGGTYCVVVPSLGSTGGVDVIQHGVQRKVVTCPR